MNTPDTETAQGYARTMTVILENPSGETLAFNHEDVEAAFVYGPIYVVREKHGTVLKVYEYPLDQLVRSESTLVPKGQVH